MAKEKIEESKVSPSSQLLTAMSSKEMKSEVLNFEDTVYWKVSSGSLLLDVEMGGGLTPGIQRLVGQNNQGKTPEAIKMLESFLDAHPKDSLGIYIKAEGRLSEENIARSKRKFTTDPNEWTNDTIFILESNVYEGIVDILRDLIRNNPNKIKYGFIIDSTDGLILRADLGKSGEESFKVAGPALISKKFLQNLNGALTKFGHLGILIGHATSEVKIDPYAKTLNRGGMYSGGSALQHFPNYIFEFLPRNRDDVILDPPTGKQNDGKTKTLGHWCRICIRKSSQENKDKIVAYPIKYGKTGGKSIWVELEIGDRLIELELVKKKGSWLIFDPSLHTELVKINKSFPSQLQGIDTLYELLENNKECTDFLFNKIKNIEVSFRNHLESK